VEILVNNLDPRPVEDREVEIVERKGLGHPDSICDALAERLSVGLCRFYLEHFGMVLHHNVDKVLLWAGSSRPAFGGGEILSPMEIFLAGRATLSFEGIDVPVSEIVEESCRSWFAENFHALDASKHVKVHSLIRPGSSDLVDLYLRQRRTGKWLANDTSCGVGYAPVSPLERATLDVEHALNSHETKAAHPQLGEDVKIMSVRRGARIGLTVACAMISRHLDDLQAYLDSKTLVHEIASNAVGAGEIDVVVNTADDTEAGNVYITVCGTSAESGDDGQAGRGNRANGLITPFRPMTMESVAGKNPVTHVGKLYNVAASRIAAAIIEEIEPVLETQCALVSRIGTPVDEPHVVDIRVRMRDGVALEAIAPRVRDCTAAHIAGIGTLWEPIARGEISLY